MIQNIKKDEISSKELFKTKIKSNINKFYLFSFINMFLLYLPFLINHFIEIGFTLTQIAIFHSSMAITLALFEIPSGYIADKFGKKNSLIINVVSYIFALILLYRGTTFIPLVLAFILIGFAVSFYSGIESAFLYETLKIIKKEKFYKKYDGRAKFMSEISIISASLLGIYFIRYGVQNLLLFTIFTHILLLIVTLTFKEPILKNKTKFIKKDINIFKEVKKEFSTIKKIIKKSIAHKKLIVLFIYSFIVFGISNTIFLFYQPYFNSINLPIKYYGLAFAIFSIVASIVSLKSHELEDKIGIYKSLLIMPLFLIISLFGTAILFSTFALSFFFFRESVRGFIMPVLNDYTNKIAKTKERATILSIQSMFSRIGLVVISTTTSIISDSFGVRVGFISIGLVLTFIVILSYKKLKKFSV